MAFSSFASDLLTKPPSTRCLTKPSPRRGTVSAATTVCLVDSLAEAMSRGYVRQFGSQICLDSNGFLPQNESPSVPPQYVDILAGVTANVKAVLVRCNVRAIFVRGSLVTGNLLGGLRSDIDLIVFTEQKVNLEEEAYLRDLLLFSLRKALQVGSVDIRYLHKEKGRGARQYFCLTPTLRIILRHFAVPIYGLRADVGISDVALQPKPHLAIDIRNDITSFRRIMQIGPAESCFSLQFSAIQWLCKKCLRAIAELSALKMRAYARDLVPCYQLGSKAYPDFADTILQGLLIACASPENRYLDMRKDELLQTGASVALQFAEIVEELSIRQCFGSRPVTHQESEVVSGDVVPDTRGPLDAYENLKEMLFASLLVFNRWNSMENIHFRRRPLPVLELKGNRFAEAKVITSKTEEGGTSPVFDTAFIDVPEPVLYRDRRHGQCDGSEITSDVLRYLLQSVATVQCRVARGHDVTFCRSSHPWIEEQIFTPPSVMISLPVRDAVQRLRGCEGLSNLVYGDCEDECVYMQTKAMPRLRVFECSSLQTTHVVQEERLWISSHGTVSTLHYDASYSALYQRCGQKRLLFFPPCCLPQLGIYPLGHPLHRRGRVDLTRKDSIIFGEFWKDCASKAIEVTLQPGDLLLFPPFWSHYTETVTSSTKELSISHTLRYVYK